MLKLSKKHLLALLVMWFMAIWTISSIPGNSLPELDSFNLDKVSHISVYFVLSFLLWTNYYKGNLSKLKKPELFLGLCVLASLDEAHQTFIPNRSVSLLDLSANLTGIYLGYLILKKKIKSND